MKNKICLIVAVIMTMGLFSCSKKIHPATTETPTTETPIIVNSNTPAENKVVPAKSKKKEAAPKVISVNDLSAKKTVDGRYYYDLQGNRYWRNNKDGKYYLFNKTMYTDEAFKPK